MLLLGSWFMNGPGGSQTCSPRVRGSWMARGGSQTCSPRVRGSWMAQGGSQTCSPRVRGSRPTKSSKLSPWWLKIDRALINWWKGKPSGSIACTRKQQPRFYWSRSSVVVWFSGPSKLAHEEAVRLLQSEEVVLVNLGTLVNYTLLSPIIIGPRTLRVNSD